MSKSICIGRVVSAAVVCAFAGFAPSALGQAPITLKFATIVGLDNPFTTSAMKFKEVAEAKSGGRLKIEVYPAGQLVKSETAMMEGIQLGTVDLGAIVTPSL